VWEWNEFLGEQIFERSVRGRDFGGDFGGVFLEWFESGEVGWCRRRGKCCELFLM
jgi:hypothetical protein